MLVSSRKIDLTERPGQSVSIFRKPADVSLDTQRYSPDQRQLPQYFKSLFVLFIILWWISAAVQGSMEAISPMHCWLWSQGCLNNGLHSLLNWFSFQVWGDVSQLTEILVLLATWEGTRSCWEGKPWLYLSRFWLCHWSECEVWRFFHNILIFWNTLFHFVCKTFRVKETGYGVESMFDHARALHTNRRLCATMKVFPRRFWISFRPVLLRS